MNIRTINALNDELSSAEINALPSDGQEAEPSTNSSIITQTLNLKAINNSLDILEDLILKAINKSDKYMLQLLAHLQNHNEPHDSVSYFSTDTGKSPIHSKNGNSVTLEQLNELIKRYHRLALLLAALIEYSVITNETIPRNQSSQQLIVYTLFFLQKIIAFNHDVLKKLNIQNSLKPFEHIKFERELRHILIETEFKYLDMIEEYADFIQIGYYQQLFGVKNLHQNEINRHLKILSNYIITPGRAKEEYHISLVREEISYFAHYYFLKTKLLLLQSSHETALKYFAIAEEQYPRLDLSKLKNLNTHLYITQCCLAFYENIVIDDLSDLPLLLEKKLWLEKTLRYGKEHLLEDECIKLKYELASIKQTFMNDKHLHELINSCPGVGITIGKTSCTLIMANRIDWNLDALQGFLTTQHISFTQDKERILINIPDHATADTLALMLPSLYKKKNEKLVAKEMHKQHHIETPRNKDNNKPENQDSIKRQKFREKAAKTGKCVPYTLCASLGESKNSFFHMSLDSESRLTVPVSSELYQEVKSAIHSPGKKSINHKFEYHDDKKELQLQLNSSKRKGNAQFFATVDKEWSDQNGNMHYQVMFNTR